MACLLTNVVDFKASEFGIGETFATFGDVVLRMINILGVVNVSVIASSKYGFLRVSAL